MTGVNFGTVLKNLSFCAIAAGLMTGPALAQSPKAIKQHKAWGAYTYKDSRAGKICYILSVPTTKAPVTLNHGDVFFLVSQKPDKSSGYEPQVEVGYPLKSNAEVTISVDGKKFVMFSQGNTAWLRDVNKEPELISAMQRGRSMQVSGQSSRGNRTTYTYSLKGVTAALDEVKKCK